MSHSQAYATVVDAAATSVDHFRMVKIARDADLLNDYCNSNDMVAMFNKVIRISLVLKQCHTSAAQWCEIDSAAFYRPSQQCQAR